MDYLQGIGANFVGRKNLFGANTTTKQEEKTSAEKAPQAGVEATRQKKSPEGILNSMHQIGLQNIIAPKIKASQNDPQMAKRIADFMANFEGEVQKGLQVIAKDFPSMDTATANLVAAKAVLKASEL